MSFDPSPRYAYGYPNAFQQDPQTYPGYVVPLNGHGAQSQPGYPPPDSFGGGRAVYIPGPTPLQVQQVGQAPVHQSAVGNPTAQEPPLMEEGQPPPDGLLTFQKVALFVHVCIYLTVGILGFKYGEDHSDWTFIDGFYFTMMTMSTVGYGDISPSNSGMRVFTVFMIFWGIIFIFPAIAAAITPISVPLQSSLQLWLEEKFPSEKIDIDGDGEPDYSIPRSRVTFYFKHLFPSFLLNVVLQLIFAGIFVAIEDSWYYSDAVYHCLVTATTVGYGDQTIETQGGRLWASGHMAISVCLLGALISGIDEAREERRSELARHEQLKRRLDDRLLHNLIRTATELRPGVDHGHGLSQLEFVLCMLLELRVVDIAQLRPFLLQFKQLDATGSGRLNAHTLELHAKFSEQELERLRRVAGKPRSPTSAPSSRVPSSPSRSQPASAARPSGPASGAAYSGPQAAALRQQMRGV